MTLREMVYYALNATFLFDNNTESESLFDTQTPTETPAQTATQTPTQSPAANESVTDSPTLVLYVDSLQNGQSADNNQVAAGYTSIVLATDPGSNQFGNLTIPEQNKIRGRHVDLFTDAHTFMGLSVPLELVPKLVGVPYANVVLPLGSVYNPRNYNKQGFCPVRIHYTVVELSNHYDKSSPPIEYLHGMPVLLPAGRSKPGSNGLTVYRGINHYFYGNVYTLPLGNEHHISAAKILAKINEALGFINSRQEPVAFVYDGPLTDVVQLALDDINTTVPVLDRASAFLQGKRAFFADHGLDPNIECPAKLTEQIVRVKEGECSPAIRIDDGSSDPNGYGVTFKTSTGNNGFSAILSYLDENSTVKHFTITFARSHIAIDGDNSISNPHVLKHRSFGDRKQLLVRIEPLAVFDGLTTNDPSIILRVPGQNNYQEHTLVDIKDPNIQPREIMFCGPDGKERGRTGKVRELHVKPKYLNDFAPANETQASSRHRPRFRAE